MAKSPPPPPPPPFPFFSTGLILPHLCSSRHLTLVFLPLPLSLPPFSHFLRQFCFFPSQNSLSLQQNTQNGDELLDQLAINGHAVWPIAPSAILLSKSAAGVVVVDKRKEQLWEGKNWEKLVGQGQARAKTSCGQRGQQLSIQSIRRRQTTQL